MNAVRLPTAKRLIVALLILSLVFTFNMGFAKQVFGEESQSFTIQSNEGTLFTKDSDGKNEGHFQTFDDVYISGHNFDKEDLYVMLTNESGANIFTSESKVITVNPNGKIELTKLSEKVDLSILVPGQYKVWVSPVDPQIEEWTENNSKTKIFRISTGTGVIAVVKTMDDDTNIPSGISFKLAKDGFEVTKELSIGSDLKTGTVTFDNLDNGTYSLTEEDGPSNYTPVFNGQDVNKYEIVISDGSQETVNVVNTYVSGSITVNKTMSGGSTESPSGIFFQLAKVQGDTETLLDPKQEVIIDNAQPSQGTVTFSGLRYGKYKLIESEYDTMNYEPKVEVQGQEVKVNLDEYEIDITSEKQNQVVNVVNLYIGHEEGSTNGNATITITKTFTVGGHEIGPEQGIEFYLSKVPLQDNFVVEDNSDIFRIETTDSNGNISFDDLDRINYYLNENVPANCTSSIGFNHIIDFTSEENANKDVINVQVVNSYDTGIVIEKTKDINGTISNHPGVTFNLTPVIQAMSILASDQESPFPLSGITDEDGILVFGPLTQGDYQLDEIIPESENYTSLIKDFTNGVIPVENGHVTVVKVLNTYPVSGNDDGGDDDGEDDNDNHHHHDDGDDDEEETVVIPEEEPVVAPPTEEIEEPVAVIVPEEPKVTAPQLPKTGGDPMSFVIFGSALSALGIYLRRRS